MSKKIIGRQSITRGSDHREALIEAETMSLDEFYKAHPEYDPKHRTKIGR